MIVLRVLVAVMVLASPSVEVARVGSSIITRAELAGRLEHMRRSGDAGGPLDAVNGLIGERLLEAEGRRLGLAETPSVKARIEAERRLLAAQLFEEREFLAKVKVDEAELRTLYHSTADGVRLDLLAFDSEHTAAAAVARAGKAGDLAAAAVLAIRRTESAALFRAQVDPRLVDRAFAAPIGEVQGPLEASVGWAVFKVLERRLGDEAGFQARRAALAERAAKGAAGQARAHVVRQLRAEQGVRLDEAFIDSTPKGTEATPAQAAKVIASVGGRPLTYGEILPAVSRITSTGGHRASAAVKKQVAWQEIDDRLFADAAMKRGYGDDPWVKARLPAAESVAVIRAYAAQVTALAPAPTDREISAYYEKHKGEIGQTLEKARPEVARQLAALKRDEALLARVRELRAKTTVEIKQDVVAEVAGGR